MVYRDHCTYFRNGSCLYVLLCRQSRDFSDGRRSQCGSDWIFCELSNFRMEPIIYQKILKFYQDGVMFCVYDDNGKLLYGTMPEKFPKQTMLKSHTPRVITSGSSKWMVYDSVHTYGQE